MSEVPLYRGPAEVWRALRNRRSAYIAQRCARHSARVSQKCRNKTENENENANHEGGGAS